MNLQTTQHSFSEAGSIRQFLAMVSALIAVGMVLAPALGFVLLLVG